MPILRTRPHNSASQSVGIVGSARWSAISAAVMWPGTLYISDVMHAAGRDKLMIEILDLIRFQLTEVNM